MTEATPIHLTDDERVLIINALAYYETHLEDEERYDEIILLGAAASRIAEGLDMP